MAQIEMQDVLKALRVGVRQSPCKHGDDYRVLHLVIDELCKLDSSLDRETALRQVRAHYNDCEHEDGKPCGKWHCGYDVCADLK